MAGTVANAADNKKARIATRMTPEKTAGKRREVRKTAGKIDKTRTAE